MLEVTVTPITIDESKFSPNRLRSAIKPRLLVPVAKGIEGDFESHVKYYSSSPTVKTEIGSLDGSVGTNDPTVRMVNEGTRAHTIRGRDGGALAFRTGYTASTTPGVIPSRPSSEGGTTIYRREVEHPGITPRKVDEAIQKKNQPIMTQRARALLRSLYGA